MNCYVRAPWTKSQITETYQCTKEMFAVSYVVMFPQIMAPGSSNAFYLANIITIPCGLICYVDDACECVVDTICYPVDACLSHR